VGAPAGSVNGAGTAHDGAKSIPWDAVKADTSITAFPEYRVSKLANVLFSRELAARLQGTGVTTYALHPGVVASDIWRRIPSAISGLAKLFMLTPEQGAQTSLHCATSPALAEETGRYYEKSREKRASRRPIDA